MSDFNVQSSQPRRQPYTIVTLALAGVALCVLGYEVLFASSALDAPHGALSGREPSANSTDAGRPSEQVGAPNRLEISEQQEAATHRPSDVPGVAAASLSKAEDALIPPDRSHKRALAKLARLTSFAGVECPGEILLSKQGWKLFDEECGRMEVRLQQTYGAMSAKASRIARKLVNDGQVPPDPPRGATPSERKAAALASRPGKGELVIAVGLDGHHYTIRIDPSTRVDMKEELQRHYEESQMVASFLAMLK
jgi:hypothetical protein